MKKKLTNTHESEFFPGGATVAVQRENSWPWIPGTIISLGDSNHNFRP